MPVRPPTPSPPLPPGSPSPHPPRTKYVLELGEPDGRTHVNGARITWYWQAEIIDLLLKRLKARDPLVEPSILALRQVWNYPEEDTCESLDVFKKAWWPEETPDPST